MRRRKFLTLLVGASAVRPIGVSAQQSARPPVVGFLVAGTQTSHGAWIAAFGQRLFELGWMDGRTVKIEYRWAAGDTRKMMEFADEFAQRKVDVIVTSAYGVVAAKQATSTIPIVFAAFGDPVRPGLVASLARPGGNMTGLTVQPTDLNSKRFQILREIMPNVRRVAALLNLGADGTDREEAGIRSAATSLNIDVNVLGVRTADDIDEAVKKLKGHADALYVFSEPLTNANKHQIVKAALQAKIPTIFGFREFVDVGGLISYGPNFTDLFKRAADFTDKILRGAKPADIPVEQPVRFDLVINLKTAAELALNIPDNLLARADEVIE
jgi:putative ABC transport system substrate-binding protein